MQISLYKGYIFAIYITTIIFYHHPDINDLTSKIMPPP